MRFRITRSLTSFRTLAAITAADGPPVTELPGDDEADHRADDEVPELHRHPERPVRAIRETVDQHGTPAVRDGWIRGGSAPTTDTVSTRTPDDHQTDGCNVHRRTVLRTNGTDGPACDAAGRSFRGFGRGSACGPEHQPVVVGRDGQAVDVDVEADRGSRRKDPAEGVADELFGLALTRHARWRLTAPEPELTVADFDRRPSPALQPSNSDRLPSSSISTNASKPPGTDETASPSMMLSSTQRVPTIGTIRIDHGAIGRLDGHGAVTQGQHVAGESDRRA